MNLPESTEEIAWPKQAATVEGRVQLTYGERHAGWNLENVAVRCRISTCCDFRERKSSNGGQTAVMYEGG